MITPRAVAPLTKTSGDAGSTAIDEKALALDEGEGVPIESRPQHPDFSRNVHCILGLPIDAVDLAAAERHIRAAAARRSPCFLSTPNVNFVIACRRDDQFRDSIMHSDLSVADGMPLVWLARLMGIPLRERVAGSTLFDALRYGPGKRLSVYFFGGPDGVAREAWRQLKSEAKGLTCVGYHSPGFGPLDAMSTDEIIQRINASKADILVVSLGARKGQAWIERNRTRLDVPVISHLGAVLHFAAGSVKRAPSWMQKIGLEWLWRIKEEPQLWRRYFDDGLALLILLLTRALPYAWYLRSHRAQPDELAAASAEVHEQKRLYVIRLWGPWTQRNIVRLRRRFYQAALAHKDIRLEMAGVTHVDTAFVGLVMLLQAHQKQQGKRLLMAFMPRTIRRVMEYCCAEFLCTR
jgi:N-acetylglucosaminyldiphosphoundecaprenol N-acetyl-beta-D-mannosaminyltransferase